MKAKRWGMMAGSFLLLFIAGFVGKVVSREGIEHATRPAATHAATGLSSPTRASASEPTTSQVEAQLQLGANELLKTTPKRVDEVTTLVDVRVSGRTMTYVHTVGPNIGAEDFDSVFVQQSLTNGVCGTPPMRRTIQNAGVTFTYEYWTTATPRRLMASIPINRCL